MAVFVALEYLCRVVVDVVMLLWGGNDAGRGVKKEDDGGWLSLAKENPISRLPTMAKKDRRTLEGRIENKVMAQGRQV